MLVQICAAMLPHALDGAVLFCNASFEPAMSAFESLMKAWSYTDEDPADVEVSIYRGAAGVCIALAGKKDFAIAIGRVLARRLDREVNVFTVSVVERGNDFECVADDVTMRVDGSTAVGRWGADVESEYGDDWGSLCDGKFYLAVSGVLEHAIAMALPDAGARESLLFHSPPSLGSPRLDELAMRSRLAERAELTEVGGRTCIRITSAGTTVTSFVDSAEADALRGMLPK